VLEHKLDPLAWLVKLYAVVGAELLGLGSLGGLRLRSSALGALLELSAHGLGDLEKLSNREVLELGKKGIHGDDVLGGNGNNGNSGSGRDVHGHLGSLEGDYNTITGLRKGQRIVSIFFLN